MTSQQVQRQIDKATTQADTAQAHDLVLCITNDGDIYRQSTTPIINNLKRHIKRNQYDQLQAVQSFYNCIVFALGSRTFNRYTSYDKHLVDVPTRYMAAVELLEYYQDEINETEVQQ